MKTSIIASLLLGSLALAAPVERRERHTKTEIITTTVYSTVTVYDDEPSAAATSSQGLFYEQPPSSSAAAPTSVVPAPVYFSSAAPVPSAQAPPKPQSSAQAAASSYVAPAPAPVVTSAAPVVQAQPSAAPAPAAPVASSAPAPAPVATTTPSTSSGDYTYTNVDMTVYNGYDSKGACETVLDDANLFAALSQGIFGLATYDIQSGAPTNPWCKKTIEVSYNGLTVTVPVQDRCAGCAGEDDVDLSPAAWKALGLDPTLGGRYKASWKVVS